MFQLSLRSLLVLVALIALAIVSLRFATEEWRLITITVLLVAFWAAVIVAVIDRGHRQAFAIGAALSMIIYLLVLAEAPFVDSAGWEEQREFNPDIGQLPTTWLLRPLFRAVAETRWIDIDTGLEAVGYDPAKPNAMQNVSLSQLPDRRTFAEIGHCWWTLLFGLVGGWFARLVYLRRMRQHDSLAADRS